MASKPWRGHMLINVQHPQVFYPSDYHGPMKWTNCTVVPDGVDLPLPPSVRRAMRALDRYFNDTAPLSYVWGAYNAWKKSTKRKGAEVTLDNDNRVCYV